MCMKYEVSVENLFLSYHVTTKCGQTDGLIDGRTDGQSDYYRAPQLRSQGPNKLCKCK